MKITYTNQNGYCKVSKTPIEKAIMRAANYIYKRDGVNRNSALKIDSIEDMVKDGLKMPLYYICVDVATTNDYVTITVNTNKDANGDLNDWRSCWGERDYF